MTGTTYILRGSSFSPLQFLFSVAFRFSSQFRFSVAVPFLRCSSFAASQFLLSVAVPFIRRSSFYPSQFLFSWSTWSAVINLTSRAGELRSAPSGPPCSSFLTQLLPLFPFVRAIPLIFSHLDLDSSPRRFTPSNLLASQLFSTRLPPLASSQGRGRSRPKSGLIPLKKCLTRAQVRCFLLQFLSFSSSFSPTRPTFAKN